jgi:hypothetical protein
MTLNRSNVTITLLGTLSSHAKDPAEVGPLHAATTRVRHKLGNSRVNLGALRNQLVETTKELATLLARAIALHYSSIHPDAASHSENDTDPSM